MQRKKTGRKKMTRIFPVEYSNLILSLCQLEASQFEWQDFAKKNSWAFSLHKSIMLYEREDPDFNYAHIKSISNMGLVIHEARISTTRFNASRNLIVRFPMSPSQGDSCTFSVVDTP